MTLTLATSGKFEKFWKIWGDQFVSQTVMIFTLSPGYHITDIQPGLVFGGKVTPKRRLGLVCLPLAGGSGQRRSPIPALVQPRALSRSTAKPEAKDANMTHLCRNTVG